MVNQNFEWEYTEQPHASRRIQILRKHPEIKKFMLAQGDPSRVYQTIIVSILYIWSTYIGTLFYKPCHFVWTILSATILGSWLLTVIHEAVHGLVFGPLRPMHNRIFGILVSQVLGFPVYTIFKRHHIDHHKYHGDFQFDIEYPYDWELKLNHHPATKLIWLQLNSILIQLKTLVAFRSAPTFLELLNIVGCFGMDIYILFCTDYPLAVGFLALGIFAASGLGIFGVWGTMVHTVFFKGEDTINYDGWLNRFYMNIGHHMEHHDFPNVPSRYLPKIREIAPEFYQDNHVFDSFYSPVIKFVFDPTIGIHSKIKRVIPSLHGPRNKVLKEPEH